MAFFLSVPPIANQQKEEAGFKKDQQSQIEEAYAKIIDLTQAQIELMNKLNEANIKHSNDMAECERTTVELASLKVKYQTLLDEQQKQK